MTSIIRAGASRRISRSPSSRFGMDYLGQCGRGTRRDDTSERGRPRSLRRMLRRWSCRLYDMAWSCNHFASAKRINEQKRMESNNQRKEPLDRGIRDGRRLRMREVCTLHSVGLLYPPSFAWLGGQMVQDTFNDNNTISLSHISYLFAISSQVMISFIAFEKEIRSRWCVLFFLPKRATSVCYPHHHCISTIHLKPPKKEKKKKRIYEYPSSGSITQKKV